MYRLTQQPTARKVTPAEAAKFLEFNNFPGQRALHEPKARRYGELLTQGKLRPVDIAFALCPDGNRYLMNGQHVCHGCIWSGREMNSVITHFKCDTWNDAWQLFATFDVHASRTQNQIFQAARGLFSNEQLRDVPLRVLNSCGTALVCLSTFPPTFANAHVIADKTTKPTLVQEHAGEVLWVSSFCDTDFLTRVGAVVSMIATYRKNQNEAEHFWRQVQSGLNFTAAMQPQKKVRDFLQKKAMWGKNSRSHHETVYAVCVSWWNSFRNGEARNSVKIGAMKELPQVLS